MTTLREDLMRVSKVVLGVTSHSVDVTDDAVYVNFGYQKALVIEPGMTTAGKRYGITLYQWDVTGGVADEVWVDAVSFADLPARVKEILDDLDRQEAAFEDMLRETFGPGE